MIVLNKLLKLGGFAWDQIQHTVGKGKSAGIIGAPTSVLIKENGFRVVYECGIDLDVTLAMVVKD